LPGGITIKPEPVDPGFPNVTANVFVPSATGHPVVIKQEPQDDDRPAPRDRSRLAGLKRKAEASPRPQWNHDLSRALVNIKTEPGVKQGSPIAKKARVDHNRNYARCQSPGGVEVITGNTKFLNEVYIGGFPCLVDPWEISAFVRTLGYNVWPRDVRCPREGNYGFIMMRNNRDAHAICNGGPHTYWHPKGGRRVRVQPSDKARAAMGLRDHKSVRWFNGK